MAGSGGVGESEPWRNGESFLVGGEGGVSWGWGVGGEGGIKNSPVRVRGSKNSTAGVGVSSWAFPASGLCCKCMQAFRGLG